MCCCCCCCFFFFLAKYKGALYRKRARSENCAKRKNRCSRQDFLLHLEGYISRAERRYINLVCKCNTAPDNYRQDDEKNQEKIKKKSRRWRTRTHRQTTVIFCLNFAKWMILYVFTFILFASRFFISCSAKLDFASFWHLIRDKKKTLSLPNRAKNIYIICICNIYHIL